jgi:hypothetical protein
MKKAPEWITETVEQHSEVFGNYEYDENYFAHLDFFAKILAKDQFSSIEFISACKQSSLTSIHENESVIFFDVAQSLLLKNAFSKISESDDLHLLTDTLKRAGCLFILHRDYNYSSLVFRHPIIEPLNYYLVGDKKLEKYKSLITPFKKIFTMPDFSHIVNYFIVGHELFHLLNRNGHFTNVAHSYRTNSLNCSNKISD